MTEQTGTSGTGEIRGAVSRIVALLRGGAFLSHGDVAALRRMDPWHPAAAFYKVEGLVLDEMLPGNQEALQHRESLWAAIVVGLAHLGALHDSGRRFGVALADAQYSELRFSRLLRADADRLTDELPMLGRFLAAKGVHADWTGAAQLILSAGGPSEEPVRRHLARDYYGTLARNEDR